MAKIPLSRERYCHVRPYAYHLTAPRNHDAIRSARRLLCAHVLAGSEQERKQLTMRRPIGVEFAKAFIRDQKPLHEGNIELAEGFTFEQLLDLLNAQVFFWPGRENGPVTAGVNHFKRYKSESPLLLRVSTTDLIEANRTRVLRVCRFNSGAPRCSGGRKSPRGPETFRPIDEFPETASKVVELTFEHAANLPDTTEIGPTPQGPWRPFF